MVVISEEIDPYAQEGTEEDTESVDYEELKKRMWKDKILLQKLKEKREQDNEPEQQAKQEASRRKKMSRAQDSVLKYMAKIMDVCKAKGFIFFNFKTQCWNFDIGIKNYLKKYDMFYI